MDSPEIGAERGQGLVVPQDSQLVELFALGCLGTWRPDELSSNVWGPNFWEGNRKLSPPSSLAFQQCGGPCQPLFPRTQLLPRQGRVFRVQPSTVRPG